MRGCIVAFTCTLVFSINGLMADGKVSTTVLKKRKKLRNIRNAERKRIINSMRRNRMRTYVAKVEKAISDAKPKEEIVRFFSEMQKEVMRAASKHIIHKNTASRKIARMCHKVKVAIGDVVKK